jgi:hypothetical protein
MKVEPDEIAFPFKVKKGSGSVSIKIYKTSSHGYDSFTLSYYQDGKRKLPTFPTFEQAKTEAEVVVLVGIPGYRRNVAQWSSRVP